jgi:DNA-binding MarR family transcriptional regulator
MRLVLEGEARSRLHEACRAVDLPINVLKALLILDRVPPAAMRDLAGHLQADASYCTALVDTLEEQGVARRQPHETDRRIKTVVLTARGRRVLGQVRALLHEPPSALSALTREEQRRLCTLLAKVAAADPALTPPRP